MSKKSRRRNKKILATIAALGGAAMLANRRRDNSIAANEAKEAGFGTEKDFKETIVPSSVVSTPVRTSTTIMDSMPKRPKFNQKSKRVTDDGKVYTIEGVKQGIVPKLGNEKSIFVGKDGSISQGGITYPNKNAYKNRTVMPSNLSKDMGIKRTPVIDDSFFSGAMAKKGGRIVKTKSGGKALRGYGRAYKGKK